MIVKVLCLIFLFHFTSVCGKLKEFVKWQTVNYRNMPAAEESSYDPYVNLPFGAAYHNGKLFVTIPRRNPGIPSTLNVLNLNDLSGPGPHLNPLLTSYPSWETNTLSPDNSPNPQKIVSVYRPRVDRCNRLWFLDTGMLEYRNNPIVVQRPSLWAIDLQTNNPMGRFELPPSVATSGRTFASLTIDDDDCMNTYVYMPSWLENALVVFSAREGRAWRFEHNFFSFNPFEGDWNVDGFQFQWNDGIFSIALSRKKPNGYRTAFFHPLSSNGEFTVSTQILKNEANANRTYHGSDFKFIGQRGMNSATGSHALDQNTNVMFYAEMQNNAVSCWNIKNDLKRANMDIVKQNNETLIYPVDLFIDNESTLWVVSNRLPRFIYGRLDTNLYNINIWREKVNDALSDTTCLN